MKLHAASHTDGKGKSQDFNPGDQSPDFPSYPETNLPAAKPCVALLVLSTQAQPMLVTVASQSPKAYIASQSWSSARVPSPSTALSHGTQRWRSSCLAKHWVKLGKGVSV